MPTEMCIRDSHRRVLLLAHGLGRVLAHADDLGRHARLAALVRRRERLHHLGRAAQHHVQGPVGLERLGHAVEHDARGVVAPHGVDRYRDFLGHDCLLLPTASREAGLLSEPRPCRVPAAHLARPT